MKENKVSVKAKNKSLTPAISAEDMWQFIRSLKLNAACFEISFHVLERHEVSLKAIHGKDGHVIDQNKDRLHRLSARYHF